VSAFEKHFTVDELSALWHLDQATIRKLFRDAPGVLRVGHGETRNKRGRVHLRIPESVATRVYAERCRKIA